MAWLIFLVLRAHGLARPALALGIVVVLALTTSLPWFASQLMPDVFFPAGVLGDLSAGVSRSDAAPLRACRAGRRDHLRRGLAHGPARSCDWPGVCALPASHPSRSFASQHPRRACQRLLSRSAFSLRRSPISPSREISSFTPGGASFFFNRLVEDGIITRYLDKSCPDPALRICVYRADISTGYDDWLWKNDTPFWKLGGWQGYSDEQRRIILATVVSDPLAHLTTAVRATLVQLVSFKTEVAFLAGENSYTIGTIRDRLPSLYPALMAARQQATPFNVAPLNAIHIPVAGLSILGLVGVLLFRRNLPDRAMAFAATVVFALIINAAVCGVFSHAADRYQSRLVPIAPLALIIVALSRRRTP